MKKSLLDTDIFSEILKAKHPTVVQRAREYRKQFSRYCLSTVTVMEVVKGLQKAGRLDRIENITTALLAEEILPLELEAAITAGRIYGELEKTGQTIGRADPLIAAIALHNNLVLVTGNTKHFERIAQLGYPLKMEDWRIA